RGARAAGRGRSPARPPRRRRRQCRARRGRAGARGAGGAGPDRETLARQAPLLWRRQPDQPLWTCGRCEAERRRATSERQGQALGLSLEWPFGVLRLLDVERDLLDQLLLARERALIAQ